VNSTSFIINRTAMYRWLFYIPPQQKLRFTVHMRSPSRPYCGILYEAFRCPVITLCMNAINSENLHFTCFSNAFLFSYVSCYLSFMTSTKFIIAMWSSKRSRTRISHVNGT